MDLDRPILIVGAPRSGKSVIGEVLRKDPQFAYLDENLMTWNVGMTPRADDRRLAAEVTPEVRDEIRKRCAEQTRKLGGVRYLDNLSYNCLRLGFVRAVMPDAKLIHIVREGEASIPEIAACWVRKTTLKDATSRTKKGLNLWTLPPLAFKFAKNYLRSLRGRRRATWGPVVPGLPKVAAERSTAIVAAYQWKGLVECALDDLDAIPDESKLQLHFEDFHEDAEDTFRRICAFVGIEDVEGRLSTLREFWQPERPPEARLEPTPEEWAEIRALIAPLQARLGYVD